MYEYVDIRIASDDNRFDGQLKKAHLETVNSNSISLRVRNQNIRFFETGLFSQFKKMQAIDLSQNLIERLDSDFFANNFRLKVIDLQKNKLSCINRELFSKQLDMEKLNLSFNEICQIEENCFYSMNLTELDLSFNCLTNVHPNGFRFLASLRKLKLDNNLICQIKLNLFALNELYLNNNLLTDFKCSLPNSIVVNLMDNCLREIGQVSFGASLSKLDLSNNEIESMNLRNQFANTPNLKQLSLKIIRKFDFESIRNLIYLQLFQLNYSGSFFNWYRSGRRLSDFFTEMIDFQDLRLVLTHFTEFYFEKFNRLKNLTNFSIECTQPIANGCYKLDLNGTFDGMTKLESITLKNLNEFKFVKGWRPQTNKFATNCLKSLTIVGLKNTQIDNQLQNFTLLTDLTISFNNLEKFNSHSLKHLENLVSLNLEHSQFRIIKKTYFRFCMFLHTLNLSYCQIRTIEPFSFLHLINLRTLNLIGNPIQFINKDSLLGINRNQCNIRFDSDNEAMLRLFL